MKRTFIFFFTALVVIAPLAGQSLNGRIYESYVSGEMDDWFAAMAEMESVYELTGSHEMLYDLIVAQYGYIAYAITEGEDRLARSYIRQAETNLEELLDRRPEMARGHALLGAIYGFKVGLNPIKAIFFGRRAFSENIFAMELDPEDPVVWMEKGNIEFYKPEYFNPSSEEAVKIYLRAVELYEEDSDNLQYNWLYLNTLRSLAEAFAASGAYKKADATYQKILRVEPNIAWIRDKAYPKFRKKYMEELR